MPTSFVIAVGAQVTKIVRSTVSMVSIGLLI